MQPKNGIGIQIEIMISLKRILFMAIIVFLYEDPLLQINALSCIHCFIFMIICYHLPYKKKLENAKRLICEMSFTVLILLNNLFADRKSTFALDEN
jgi:hypothetical protein